METGKRLGRNVYCAKVLHASIEPESRPLRNHIMRCSELPCVKESGFTCPVAIFCSRASPTPEAAPSADATSAGSSSPRCCVECDVEAAVRAASAGGGDRLQAVATGHVNTALGRAQ